MTTDDGRTAEKSLGDVVGDVSTQASLLVREEIELAKTEIAEKAKSLARGSNVASIQGDDDESEIARNPVEFPSPRFPVASFDDHQCLDEVRRTHSCVIGR